MCCAGRGDRLAVVGVVVAPEPIVGLAAAFVVRSVRREGGDTSPASGGLGVLLAIVERFERSRVGEIWPANGIFVAVLAAIGAARFDEIDPARGSSVVVSVVGTFEGPMAAALLAGGALGAVLGRPVRDDADGGIVSLPRAPVPASVTP